MYLRECSFEHLIILKDIFNVIEHSAELVQYNRNIFHLQCFSEDKNAREVSPLGIILRHMEWLYEKHSLLGSTYCARHTVSKQNDSYP